MLKVITVGFCSFQLSNNKLKKKKTGKQEMKQAGITNICFSLGLIHCNSVSLKCMLKLLYNLETSIMICIVKSRLSLHCVVFYNITKIALALWLAERHDCTRACKHSCDLKIRCCEGRVYLFYPFPWLLRLGKYLQTCWTKVFLS